jgi:hypothetical protein
VFNAIAAQIMNDQTTANAAGDESCARSSRCIVSVF